MKRIYCTLLTVFLAGWAGCAVGAAKLPNVVWIISDDLGLELGCYGLETVSTPHLDRLAGQGVRYTQAYATAPVCSASRSALITGMYQSAIACEPHRKVDKQPLPDRVQPITEYFRKKGYFVCNGNHNLSKRGKTDYNFKSEVKGGMYDGSDWSERDKNQPFFAQVQIFDPHRKFAKDTSPERREKIVLPPYYPDHPVTRADWANYLASVEVLDRKVGNILERLDNEGLADNTIVFFFGDHGRPHVRDKQWLYDGGIHTPLIIRWPGRLEAGAVDDRPVSLIDVSAASLAAADISLPKHLQGVDMLAPGFKGRDAIFASIGRLGGKLDRIRSVQVGTMKYIRNFNPGTPYMLGDQESAYKSLEYPVHTLLKYLREQGELTPEQELFLTESRPEHELYDLEKDPYELNNLAGDPEYKAVLRTLQAKLSRWMNEIGDKEGAQESSSDEKDAVKSNQSWYRSGLKKMGASPDTSMKKRLEWWADKLNVELPEE